MSQVRNYSKARKTLTKILNTMVKKPIKSIRYTNKPLKN